MAKFKEGDVIGRTFADNTFIIRRVEFVEKSTYELSSPLNYDNVDDTVILYSIFVEEEYELFPLYNSPLYLAMSEEEND